MTVKSLRAIDLYHFVAADLNNADEFGLRWYDIASELEQNENYKRLSDEEKDEFDKDLMEITRYEDVRAAFEELYNLDSRTFDNEADFFKERDELISHIIELILSKEEGNRYHNGLE